MRNLKKKYAKLENNSRYNENPYLVRVTRCITVSSKGEISETGFAN